MALLLLAVGYWSLAYIEVRVQAYVAIYNIDIIYAGSDEDKGGMVTCG